MLRRDRGGESHGCTNCGGDLRVGRPAEIGVEMIQTWNVIPATLFPRRTIAHRLSRASAADTQRSHTRCSDYALALIAKWASARRRDQLGEAGRSAQRTSTRNWKWKAISVVLREDAWTVLIMTDGGKMRSGGT